MAAIDKLYINSYHQYDELRKWAITYYPELLFYFYDITVDYSTFEKRWQEWIRKFKTQVRNAFTRFGKFTTSEEAVNNLIKHYKRTAGYDCSREQAEDEFKYWSHQMEVIESDSLCELEYKFPVMNTPLSVDKKLKWICPVPCIRKYLHEQCGVNPKWEWLYKIFWKGKKHF